MRETEVCILSCPHSGGMQKCILRCFYKEAPSHWLRVSGGTRQLCGRMSDRMKDGDSSDSLTRSTLMAVVPLLVLLFAPVAAWGEVTLFLEDFDDPELAHWSDQGGSRTGPVSMDYASCSVHDGYGFLNLSGTDPAEIDGTGGEFKIYSTEYYLYAGLEMRMRLSSDNKLESDVGGGIRRWGFRSGATQWALTFTSQEEGILPAKDQWWGTEHPGREYLGFGLGSRINDEFSFHQNIEGVDLTEWHTYTILWEPEAATFLIDGDVVAVTTEVPQIPMKVYLRMASGENLTLPCQTVEGEEICTDEYVQIDYVRIFASEKEFGAWSDEISQLFSTAEGAMTEAETRGIDTSELKGDCYDKAADYWRGGSESDRHYNPLIAAPYLETVIEYLGQWDEGMDLFSQANAIIENWEQQATDTRTINMAKGYYSAAEGRWRQYDIEGTRRFLQNILDIPEASLLPLVVTVGVLLLPTVMKRIPRGS